jgi:pimeloyl-ACP methyl ester carboxylesterase
MDRDAVAPLAHRVDGPDGAPATLLLNGGMMTYGSWSPVADALAAAGRRVVRCDFRGQLLSPGDPPATFEGHAGDVVALLDGLGLDRVDVVGTSFGGQVGLVLAADHGDRVRSLTAITVTDRSGPLLAAGSRKTREACREILAGGDRGALHDLLTAEVYSTAWREAHREEIDRRRTLTAALPDAWFHGVLGLLEALDEFDLGPRLASVRCPTWIVAAGDDRVMPLEGSRRLAAGIAGATLEVHDGAGHALVLERAPELIAGLLAFLDRSADPGGIEP